jgi:hypothetical protein
MMRTKAAYGFGAAVLLATSGAWAADASKGEAGSKVDPGKAVAPAAPAEQPSIGPSITSLSESEKNRNPDRLRNAEETKAWDIGATFETHRLIRQDDLGGAASQKVFNAFGLFADYRLTQHDIVTIRDYFTENFLADQGETGVRSGDVTLSYTHVQPLPKEFTLAGTFALSAPTSFQSQKASQITDPTLILSLDKRFGRYLTLVARVSTGFIIDKYREAEGGAANPEFHLGGTVGAHVTMPFHEPLMVGIDASTSYTWFYDVQSSDPNVVQPGVVQDTQFSNQPIQQNYGGEIFARYTLPSLAGVKSDLQIALAQGDPTLGYTSFLHDGVGYTYLFFRQTSEVYASFSISY